MRVRMTRTVLLSAAFVAFGCAPPAARPMEFTVKVDKIIKEGTLGPAVKSSKLGEATVYEVTTASQGWTSHDRLRHAFGHLSQSTRTVLFVNGQLISRLTTILGIRPAGRWLLPPDVQGAGRRYLSGSLIRDQPVCPITGIWTLPSKRNSIVTSSRSRSGWKAQSSASAQASRTRKSLNCMTRTTTCS
jgi:hypothetical protein